MTEQASVSSGRYWPRTARKQPIGEPSVRAAWQLSGGSVVRWPVAGQATVVGGRQERGRTTTPAAGHRVEGGGGSVKDVEEISGPAVTAENVLAAVGLKVWVCAGGGGGAGRENTWSGTNKRERAGVVQSELSCDGATHGSAAMRRRAR